MNSTRPNTPGSRRRRLAATVLLAAAAAALPGCTAVVIGTGVAATTAAAYDRRTTGTMLDDETIEFRVEGALKGDEELYDQSHINVVSYNSVVLLTGETPSETLRTRAVELARNTPKVRTVHNELTIAAPTSMMARSNDTVITGKVKTGLANVEVDLAARTKVVTENDVVYLMGLVTREEGDAAANVARRVSGVAKVVKVFEYVD